ncbi:MAG: glycosyltransferase family 4 protein [Sphingobacteriales bacterium]|nr:glycosyltransferase family 4 protein [Sphingobacteriales bacterium]
MKKVLAIAPYPYLPFFSGGQKFIANFFEHLSNEARLTVISVASNDTTLAKGYHIIPMLKKSFARYYDRSLIAKITALIQKEKFDAVIWEHPYYWWLARRIKRKTGVKTIIHTHNIEYQRFRSTGRWWWPILRRYERRCLQHADAVFFITPEDKNFAISDWRLQKEKCIDVPFGIDVKASPSDKSSARNLVCQKHHIDPSEKILLFNGLLKYKPNFDAVKAITEKINPLLLQLSFRYKIIICGKDLPLEMNSLKEYADKNIIYPGFVDDIETYFKAADIFLNPVISGGGVKTKMVEAIGFGTTVISTATGAAGVDKNVCGDKLIILPDNDWRGFANAIIETTNKVYAATPDQYYQLYAWENIIPRIVSAI